MKRMIRELVSSLTLPALAGLIGSGVAVSALHRIRMFEKPAFMPPVWLVSPLWALAYTLAGIGLFLGWRSRRRSEYLSARKGFIVQWIMNIIWFFLFYYNGLLFSFLFGLIFLGASIAMLIAFCRTGRPFWFFVPYVSWIAFNIVLNGAFYLQNR